MSDTIWLAVQAIGTMVIVIVLAYVSWRQTRRMLARRQPRTPSALARATPDPQAVPDPEVTDPFHATSAPHAASSNRSEPGHPGDVEWTFARARAASVQHPSAVERLDGVVTPLDPTNQGDGASRPTVGSRTVS